MDTTDSRLSWSKSSFCVANGNQCAEVARTSDGGRLIRSSQTPGVSVRLDADEWDAFVKGIQNGEFSR